MGAISSRRIHARAFLALLGAGAAVLAVALAAAHFMEEHGHVVTGMNNQVVWGLPHVFAIFLIVAASGALNVASIGSVFGESAYKPFAPLSVLLTVALLAGGLMVLVLDLGRPERLVVAATHYNFRSIFAWNMILYNGLFAICGALPVVAARAPLRPLLASPSASPRSRGASSSPPARAPSSASSSRARPTPPAVIAPLFIALSLAWGLAVFHLAQAGLARLGGRADGRRAAGPRATAPRDLRDRGALLRDGSPPDQPLLGEAGRLRALHPRERRAVRGALLGRASSSWGAWSRSRSSSIRASPGRGRRVAASALVSLGGTRLPLRLHHRRAGVPARDLPGLRGDERLRRRPRSMPMRRALPEFLLGLGGLAASFLIALVGVRALPILPPEKVAFAAAAPSK